MKAFLIALALVAPLANAAPFSQADIIRQSAVSVLLIADYGFTKDQYAKRDIGYSEINPLIRAHYSEPGIRNYFAVAVVGSAAVARALPAEWRPAFQYTVIALEVAAVIKNKKVGLHMRF